jgi:hypothetical protein
VTRIKVLYVGVLMLIALLSETLAIRYFRWEGHLVAGLLLAATAGLALLWAARICWEDQ